MKEIWKDIPEYNGAYQASNLGNIRSTDRFVKCKHGDAFRRGKVLKPAIMRGGYLGVNFSVKSVTRSHHVHFLVAWAFIGERKKGFVINHKDGDRFNNSVKNLEYVTARENVTHSNIKTRKNMTCAFLNKKTNKWFCRFHFDGKLINLGTYNTAKEANAAYLSFLKLNNVVNKYAI